MKFKYLPGLRPTPLLMYYNEANLEMYQNHIKEAKNNLKIDYYERFTEQGQHYWNPGAYLIIDNEKIISHAISFFPNFLYLLRAINQPLEWEFTEQEYVIFKNDLECLKDEFAIIVE